jgi:hypothetical protein
VRGAMGDWNLSTSACSNFFPLVPVSLDGFCATALNCLLVELAVNTTSMIDWADY